jgi:integrase
LDFYPAILHPNTGQLSRREYLNLYIPAKPKTAFERQQVKDLRAIAEAIRAKRLVSILNEDFGFLATDTRSNSFLEYFEQLGNERTGDNRSNWKAAYLQLYAYCNGKCKVADVNERFCEGFLEHLQNQTNVKGIPFSQSSIYSYFAKFKAALKQAVKDKLLAADPSVNVKVKQGESQRDFLSLDELKTLSQTECSTPNLKQMALFSALTGMRWSDVSSLTWGQIRLGDNAPYIVFRQIKTKGAEHLPINEQALSLLGQRGQDADRVFDVPSYSNWVSKGLTQWLKSAGIQRHITFHCFRHTFATLQLQHGTDIATISKMLGHRELKTTQLYAKVVDNLKVEAANRIKL